MLEEQGEAGPAKTVGGGSLEVRSGHSSRAPTERWSCGRGGKGPRHRPAGGPALRVCVSSARTLIPSCERLVPSSCETWCDFGARGQEDGVDGTVSRCSRLCLSCRSPPPRHGCFSEGPWAGDLRPLQLSLEKVVFRETWRPPVPTALLWSSWSLPGSRPTRLRKPPPPNPFRRVWVSRSAVRAPSVRGTCHLHRSSAETSPGRRSLRKNPFIPRCFGNENQGLALVLVKGMGNARLERRTSDIFSGGCLEKELPRGASDPRMPEWAPGCLVRPRVAFSAVPSRVQSGPCVFLFSVFGPFSSPLCGP